MRAAAKLDKNREGKAPVRAADFLRAVMDEARLHSLWLNTLSFLEYIGARKIAKALPQEAFNERLLEHFSEEARHSLYFKNLARIARRGGGGATSGEKKTQAAFDSETAGGGWNPGFKEEELLSGRAAREYFQSLDNKAKALSEGDIFLNYLLSSCAVERRAVSVYSIYNRLLKEKQFSFNLDPVLKDEKKHWTAMREEIKRRANRREQDGREQDMQNKLAALLRFEEAVFPAFLQCLWKAAEQAKTAAGRGDYGVFGF